MTNTQINPVPLRKRIVLGLAATAALVAVIPATHADAAANFGAKLTPDVQPSNAGDGHPCEPAPGKCTRVSMEAYGRPDGGEKAPKDGTIKKIRIIAQAPGNFRLQIADAKPDREKARVTYTSQRFHHEGQTDPGALDYEIESFRVNAHVEKGQYLGILSRKTSMLRCSSGGPNQLLFQPPLSVGTPFQKADATDGCWLLLEAVYE